MTTVTFEACKAFSLTFILKRKKVLMIENFAKKITYNRLEQQKIII